jgi:uncharacterized protein (DUF736 family)
MAFDNTDRGILFPKKDKKSEKQPDYDGKINVGGKDYALAGWKKTSQKGATFLSLKISEAKVVVNGQRVDSDNDF